MLKKILLVAVVIMLQLLLHNSAVIGADKPIPVSTVMQKKIRPSYPFPNFLSTGPYVWYENSKNTPIKGHAFRVAKFLESNNASRIYLEKVLFGIDGCCLEIVEYRQIFLNEDLFQQHFPHNRSSHGFKLKRWVDSQSFQFNAYGGDYVLTNIGNELPLLEEIK